MPNQLYNDMNANKPQGNSIGAAFMGFMDQMRGHDPQKIINQMVQSGQLTQQQLNIVQQKANELNGMFGQFKSRFGF